MNLTLTKQRLKGAQTGHSLLAKKRDALMMKFRAILRKVDEVRVFHPDPQPGNDAGTAKLIRSVTACRRSGLWDEFSSLHPFR
jgi:hypothetical protein